MIPPKKPVRISGVNVPSRYIPRIPTVFRLVGACRDTSWVVMDFTVKKEAEATLRKLRSEVKRLQDQGVTVILPQWRVLGHIERLQRQMELSWVTPQEYCRIRTLITEVRAWVPILSPLWVHDPQAYTDNGDIEYRVDTLKTLRGKRNAG